MAYAAQILVSGVTVGAIYALVAIGFTLIYRASDIFNFAQGEFFMLGGMITGVLLLTTAMPFAIAALIAILITTAAGLAIHFFAIRPAKSAGPVQLLIITIGASVLIRGLTSATLGKDFVSLPPFLPVETLHIGGVVVQTQAVVVIAGTVAIVGGLWAFLGRTLTGKAVTAVAANGLAARLVGINTALMVGLCFAISALIGAIGGVIATPITLTSFDSGTLMAVKGFAAAMLGGVGHPIGPVVGGLLIGLLEAFGAGYISSTYKDAFALIVLLAVFVFRPQGLFGSQAVERV